MAVEGNGGIELLELIGEGGSAEVRAGRLRGRQVALKLPKDFGDSKRCERFLDEARMLQRVRHPHVIEVIDAGLLPDGRPYLAMPLLRGETLAQRLARSPLSLEHAMRIFDAIADGVSALHDAGLVHRDLKPENVFLLEDETPLVLDLGIAKEAGSAPSTATQDGVVRGTPSTMAPERFFGASASEASDVYELALTLYAMLAGRLPWDDAADADARLHAPSLTELGIAVPRALSDEIAKALSTRPERRPPSVRALRDRVRTAAAVDDPASRRTAEVPVRDVRERPPISQARTPDIALVRPRREPRRASASTFVAIAMTLIAGVSIFVAWRASRGPKNVSTNAPAVAQPSSPIVSASASASTTIAEPSAQPIASSLPAAAPAPTVAQKPVAPVVAAKPPVLTTTKPVALSGALPWCTKIRDTYCDPELVATPRGPEACRAGQSILDLAMAAPDSEKGVHEDRCKLTYASAVDEANALKAKAKAKAAGTSP